MEEGEEGKTASATATALAEHLLIPSARISVAFPFLSLHQIPFAGTCQALFPLAQALPFVTH